MSTVKLMKELLRIVLLAISFGFFAHAVYLLSKILRYLWKECHGAK